MPSSASVVSSARRRKYISATIVVVRASHASVSDVVGNKESTIAKMLLTSQPFWVTVALFVLIMFMVMSVFAGKAMMGLRKWFIVDRS